MGPSQGVVCFNFNVLGVYIQDSVLRLFSFYRIWREGCYCSSSLFYLCSRLFIGHICGFNPELCVQRTVGMAQYFGHMASFASSVAGVGVGGIKQAAQGHTAFGKSDPCLILSCRQIPG